MLAPERWQPDRLPKSSYVYVNRDPSLASTRLQQGRVAACHALDTPSLPESPWFPYGIYSVPEISTCGMSEEETQSRGIPYEVGIARFRETSRGHIMGLEHGMLKMLFSLKTRRVLGVQIVGEGATELIHIAQAVLNLKGTVDYFVQNTFNYPTLAEAYKIAGLDAFNRMPIPEELKVSKGQSSIFMWMRMPARSRLRWSRWPRVTRSL